MQNILVVDDLAENRFLLQTILEHHGYAVTVVTNGAEALAAARSRPPDLVISDILMPVMDGFMLCRQWRQDPVLRGIPFIFHSASYTDARDKQLAMSLGADRFLGEPVEADVIVATVRQLLGDGIAPALPPQNAAPKPGFLEEYPEPVYLKEYNEVLIRRLEDKNKALQAANLRLRALDGMKNNLLANISHELRTPLVAVRGYTELICAGMSGPVSPQQRDQCGVMLRNIDRQLMVINNLLQLASLVHLHHDVRAADELALDIELRNGGLPLNFTTFPAGGLLDEVANLVRDKARERNITLRSDGGAVEVCGDRGQLLQALVNLADNAVKFTPPGGAVSIGVSATPTETQFHIRDSGPGIAADSQQNIFEQFYQLNSSATREHGGLGIGLSVAADLIGRHHGRINVASEPGQGALFTVTLPRPAASA